MTKVGDGVQERTGQDQPARCGPSAPAPVVAARATLFR
jgi:hypothetical protein